MQRDRLAALIRSRRKMLQMAETLECRLIGDSGITPEEKQIIHNAAVQLAALLERE